MEDSAGIIALIGRILFVAMFLGAGINHLKNRVATTAHAKASGFPIPVLGGAPTGAWLVAGSVSIAVGILPDLGALMFAVFTLPAAFFFHAFWKVEDAMKRRMEQMAFMRNVTLFGASLLLFALFASIDTALRFAVTGSLITF